jgi:DNA topoisomerase-3
MPKTLVIAEKPSVARDIAAALPGAFRKEEGYLESEEFVITYAVGHLVELINPEDYSPQYKRWRFDDLPIVPDRFKLGVRDEKNAKKQLKAIHTLLERDDVERIVNACDAGREGELIFAYTLETSGVDKPVERLWLNSMTKKAIQDAFERLRPGDEMKSLEAAARSRSEADWLVGMNATRAATIRLRGAFDGAVSLGRVQTPTLALVARREEDIRAFRPEPYWLVEAAFAAPGDRLYSGRYLGGKRLPAEAEAKAIVDACTDQPGEITKLEKKEERQKPELLYDLTALQRHANTQFGFSARRTLAAAQKLYEDRKAITYPRTSSRYLSSELVDEIRPTVELVGRLPEYAKSARYVLGLRELPLARVVDDAKVGDHHAIIPTKNDVDPGKWGEDEQKIHDLVARRFLAVFHPEAVFERTRVETTVQTHVFRTSGRVLLQPGWRAVYGETAEERTQDDDSGGDQLLPRLEHGERVETRSVEALAKETQPPRRYTEASLLAAMETAGKDIEDETLREAMKESGIGTPATRAAIIERLIQVGYIEREGRALHATDKGIQVIRLLGSHPLTSPELTGDWEHRLDLIERGEDSRDRFMDDIVKFTTETVGELDKLKEVRIERANLGPCPVCGRDVIENRKGFSCWSKDDPGCGFVIWKNKAGKTLTASIAKQLMGTGRTEKPVPGFRGRSGRSFTAKLKLVQTEEGKWRVEFDEEWATAQPPVVETNGAPGSPDGAAAESQAPSDGGRRTRAAARARS